MVLIVTGVDGVVWVVLGVLATVIVLVDVCCARDDLLVQNASDTTVLLDRLGDRSGYIAGRVDHTGAGHCDGLRHAG